MATNKIQIGFRIAEPLHAKARALAEKEHRSLNNLIHHALQTYVDAYEQKNGALPPPSADLED